MGRTELSPDDLRKMARHVTYEVDRLRYWLMRGSLHEQDFAGPPNLRAHHAVVVGEAILEATLLHARNVASFVLDPRPRAGALNETDVVADHYFDDGWSSRPPFVFGSTVDRHREVKRAIDRRLAHTSSERLGDQFVWDSLISDLECAVSAFSGFLTDLRRLHRERAAWFDG